MLARSHGETPRLREARPQASVPRQLFSVLPVVEDAPGKPFGFMFGTLADDPANRLPEGPETISALRALGEAMAQDPSNENGVIPAAYTYFGQFVDHDISKTVFPPSIGSSGGLDIIELPNFSPLSRGDAEQLLTNARSAPLDLDSLYGGLAASHGTFPNGRMALGQVSVAPVGTIPTADRNHDLPRRPMIPNPKTLEEQALDREALIGDPRNDENLLVGQMHVAFIRTHNKLMDLFGDAQTAQREMRRRYQWAVLHDFLPRVCDPQVVSDVLTNGPSVWKAANPAELFMPLEFSGAAYRFGHSMVRQEYNHNETFNPNGIPATFNFMFTFTALSGDISPNPGGGSGSEFPTLPDNWIIDWPRFFDDASSGSPGLNPARRIDTHLASELGQLPDAIGQPIFDLMGRLAARNLLRGYLLGLPTGQAVARELGVTPLSATTLLEAVPEPARAAFQELQLTERTPLWFYILAEAGDPQGANGQHLGVVGSRIVAETLWNLAAHASDSVVSQPPTEAEIESGEFTLRGLIKLGADSGMPQL